MPELEEKRNHKSLWISLIVTSLLALIIGVLLLVRYCAPTSNNNESKNRNSYLFNYSPSLISEEVGLIDNSLSLSLSSGDHKYIAEVNIASGNSNILLGSYLTHDYLIKSYGRSNNTLVVSINFYIDNNGHKGDVVTDYEDLSFIIYLGEDDNHKQFLEASKYNVSNNEMRYVTSGDIYLQDVGVSISL